jgi:hypothetical protein
MGRCGDCGKDILCFCEGATVHAHHAASGTVNAKAVVLVYTCACHDERARGMSVAIRAQVVIEACTRKPRPRDRIATMLISTRPSSGI